MDKVDGMLHRKEKYLQFCIIHYAIVHKKSKMEEFLENRLRILEKQRKKKRTQFFEQVLAYAEKHPTKGKIGSGKEGVYFCLDGDPDKDPSLKKHFKRKKKKKKRKISRNLYICIKKSYYHKIAKEYDFLRHKQQKEVTVEDMQRVIVHILYNYLGIEEAGCTIPVNSVLNLPLYLQKKKKIQYNPTLETVSNRDLLFFDTEENDEDFGFHFDYDLPEGWPSSLAINNVRIILGFPEGPLKIKENKQELTEKTDVQHDTPSTKQHASNPTVIDLSSYFNKNDIDPDSLLSPKKEQLSQKKEELPLHKHAIQEIQPLSDDEFSNEPDLSLQHQDNPNILISNFVKLLVLAIISQLGVSTLQNKYYKRSQKNKKKRKKEQ